MLISPTASLEKQLVYDAEVFWIVVGCQIFMKCPRNEAWELVHPVRSCLIGQDAHTIHVWKSVWLLSGYLKSSYFINKAYIACPEHSSASWLLFHHSQNIELNKTSENSIHPSLKSLCFLFAIIQSSQGGYTDYLQKLLRHVWLKNTEQSQCSALSIVHLSMS